LADGRTVRDVDRVSDLPDRYDHADFSGDRSKEVDIPEIDVVELARRHQAGATLIDVRQPDEYESGHVPGAVLIPLAEVPDRVGEVPAGGEVLVICKSGSRSRSASEFLRTQGIDAINVAGGTQAWIRSGHTVVGGDRPG
jgi:rhodanese-related sulfurtransferase